MVQKPTGRAALFRDKQNGVRVQGLLTAAGGAAFEKQRERIARITERDPSHVSDADVIEWMARGELAALKAIGKRK